LNRCATRRSANCAVSVSFWLLKSVSSWAWIVAADMPGSKMRTFGPKSGVSDCVGQPAWVPIV
jgi:hypothetical protein